MGGLSGPLGGLLGSPGDISGPRARNVRSGPPSGPALGAVLGASWAILEVSGALLGPSGAVSGRSWRPRRPCWGDLGGFLGRLGALVSRRGENAKIIKKPKENHRFLLVGGLLGGLLEASWGVLGASWAVLRPSGPSWSALGLRQWGLPPIWRLFGALRERSGGLQGGAQKARHPWPDLAGDLPGYFSTGDPQGPPRARELEKF